MVLTEKSKNIPCTVIWQEPVCRVTAWQKGQWKKEEMCKKEEMKYRGPALLTGVCGGGGLGEQPFPRGLTKLRVGSVRIELLDTNEL